MRLRIEAKQAEERLAEARAAVTASGLPALLARVDSGAFGTTPLNLEALKVVADAASVALALASASGGGLSPLYLGFVFAQETADRLDAVGGKQPKDSDGQGALPEGQYHDLVRADPPRVLRSLLDDCRSFVAFYHNHADASRRLCRDEEALLCLKAYFRLIGNTLSRLLTASALRREPGSGSDADIQTPRLKLNGLRVSKAAVEDPVELLPVTFDDIVGNEEMVKAGRRLARDVAGFDLASGKNPKKVRNQIMFTLGAPGCGKTVAAHAILQYFLKTCEAAGLPAKTRIIRRTDWASAYQNQSASRLLEIFRDEVFNAPGVCAAYWPDIDTAFAARGDSEIRQEEKSNLGTLFGILDGTIGPKNGKWLLLCDANTLHMDDATLSRLSQSPIKALGPVTPADFVRLLRDIKLRGKEPCLPIDDAGWAAIGARCVERKLSGRSIENISGRVLTEIEDFDEPDEYFKLPYEEKRKLIAKLSRPVGRDRILALVEDHCRFEREAQEKAEEEKFRRRVDEIRLHLSAQRAAVGALSERDDGGRKA